MSSRFPDPPTFLPAVVLPPGVNWVVHHTADGTWYVPVQQAVIDDVFKVAMGVAIVGIAACALWDWSQRAELSEPTPPSRRGARRSRASRFSRA